MDDIGGDKLLDQDGLSAKQTTKTQPLEPNLALFAALRRNKAIFCQECGTKIEVGLDSCPKCGWKTQDEDAVKNSAQYKEALEMAKEVERLQPVWNTVKKGGLLFIGLVMALAIGILGCTHGVFWAFPIFVVLWVCIVLTGIKANRTHQAARLLFERGFDMNQVRPVAKTAIQWGNMWLVGIVLSVFVPGIVGIFVLASIYGWVVVIGVYILLSFAGWLFRLGLM